MQLEGIVSTRKAAPYRSGEFNDWCKVKTAVGHVTMWPRDHEIYSNSRCEYQMIPRAPAPGVICICGTQSKIVATIDYATRKSSFFVFPPFVAAVIQRGMRPRPVQVFPAPSRYLTATLPRVPLPRPKSS